MYSVQGYAFSEIHLGWTAIPLNNIKGGKKDPSAHIVANTEIDVLPEPPVTRTKPAKKRDPIIFNIRSITDNLYGGSLVGGGSYFK